MPLSPEIQRIIVLRPTTIAHLQHLLGQQAQISAFNNWFSRKFTCLQALIKESVSGSTFRAYRSNVTYTPSSLFRTWAQNFPSTPHISTLASATTRSLFDIFHNAAADDFLNYWNKNDGYPSLNWGQSRKLFDLFIKHLALWESLDPKARKNILDFGRVPLDKYTLGFASKIAPSRPALLDPTNWTMGFITSSSAYNDIQRDIETSVGTFLPYAFEIFAWNSMHPRYHVPGANVACLPVFSLVQKILRQNHKKFSA